MEKKRSVGVRVFGILLILSSLYKSLGFMHQNFYNIFKILMQPLPDGIILVRFYFGAILQLIAIIAGIGVIFFKNIFRKLVLFFGSFVLYSYIFEMPVFGFRNLPKLIEQKVVHTGIAESTIWAMMIIPWLLDFCFAVVILYFFTRPEIKEQFK